MGLTQSRTKNMKATLKTTKTSKSLRCNTKILKAVNNKKKNKAARNYIMGSN